MGRGFLSKLLNEPDPSIVREYMLKNRLNFDDEKEIQNKVLEIGAKLGDKGRFILKRSGLPGKISVFVESKDFNDCKKYIKEFEEFLKDKEYL